MDERRRTRARRREHATATPTQAGKEARKACSRLFPPLSFPPSLFLVFSASPRSVFLFLRFFSLLYSALQSPLNAEREKRDTLDVPILLAPTVSRVRACSCSRRKSAPRARSISGEGKGWAANANVLSRPTSSPSAPPFPRALSLARASCRLSPLPPKFSSLLLLPTPSPSPRSFLASSPSPTTRTPT
ncbi:hypothetical protein C8R45DRAFT_1186765, partial [Mycena sanguinolenta]